MLLVYEQGDLWLISARAVQHWSLEGATRQKKRLPYNHKGSDPELPKSKRVHSTESKCARLSHIWKMQQSVALMHIKSNI